jgi:prepilin-type processing-associated H-X9-DG protein
MKVAVPDPKQFLILDFPKPVADFSGGDDDSGKWHKYFFTDFDEWRREFGTGELPSQYQALRHMEKANVLFVDGHIEGLGIQDLKVSNPLWRSQGR